VRRFRPILLTAAAAILAMVPLSRSDFFGPQAIAIMGGLTVETVLTIFFLPALYAAWFRVRRTMPAENPEHIVALQATVAWRSSHEFAPNNPVTDTGGVS